MNQKTGIRHILVFENRDTPGLRVAAELHKFADIFSFHVTTITNLATIRQTWQTQAFAAVIIEVGRETGDAMSVLRLLGKGDQSTPLYVYNGFMLPKIAEKSLEYSQVQYFEDHVNFDRFITMILDELSRKRRGIIHGIALGNFLQLMNQEKFNGRIIVTTGEKRGVLFLQGGQLIGANTNGSRKDTALAEMSEWEKVTVEIREERPANEIGVYPSPKTDPAAEPTLSASPLNHEVGTGRIDIMRFSLKGKRITVNIKKLNAALQEIQGMLADVLLRMDIFLSADGRSLTGWNSHPLACSAFAAITRSVRRSLKQSAFPQLQHYYLLELADEHMVLILIRDELQWGLLLKGAHGHLGLLLNFVMPKALNALADALTENTRFGRSHG